MNVFVWNEISKAEGHSESSTRKEREKKKYILKENVEEPITHILARLLWQRPGLNSVGTANKTQSWDEDNLVMRCL